MHTHYTTPQSDTITTHKIQLRQTAVQFQSLTQRDSPGVAQAVVALRATVNSGNVA
jgi:hypothetical protein